LLEAGTATRRKVGSPQAPRPAGDARALDSYLTAMSAHSQTTVTLASLVGAVALIVPTQSSRPRYEDYPVPQTFSGAPAPVDLSTAEGARRYRTVLRAGARAGPNFAGHFALVQWGCGSPCKEFAVIDVATGRVWRPHVWMGLGASFRLNSKLVIVDGPEYWQDAWFPDDSAHAWMPTHAFYYVWEGDSLRLLDSARITRPSAR
jgi:hypothetical protein